MDDTSSVKFDGNIQLV